MVRIQIGKHGDVRRLLDARKIVEKKTGEYMRVGISKGGCLETDVLIDQVDWRAVRRIKGD